MVKKYSIDTAGVPEGEETKLQEMIVDISP